MTAPSLRVRVTAVPLKTAVHEVSPSSSSNSTPRMGSPPPMDTSLKLDPAAWHAAFASASRRRSTDHRLPLPVSTSAVVASAARARGVPAAPSPVHSAISENTGSVGRGYGAAMCILRAAEGRWPQSF